MKQVSSSSSAAAIDATDDKARDAAVMPPSSSDRTRRFVGTRRVLRRLWSIMTANRKALAGSIIIAAFITVALVGPIILRQNPLAYTKALVQPPSSAHLLGTNQVGQDIFVQLIVGTRSSVVWAFITGLMVMVISIAVGLVAGYLGGIVDDILSVITNVFLVVPAFPLAIIAVQYFNRSSLTIAVVVALTNWPWGARVLRAQTLSMRNREYVTAARAVGEKTWRIIFQEILPNEIAIVAASFITTTIQVLLAVAALEFLGFGDSQTISWGTMLYNAQADSAVLQSAWWWFAPPGLCIALLGAGLLLLNFGIDEVADPRLRQVKRRVRRGKAAAA
ncbi:MAG TPA: ABC transporter permease [Ktedonobacterales bacterium]|nr:ABC transporter permease [Ktedonobacterales bacterium]